MNPSSKRILVMPAFISTCFILPAASGFMVEFAGPYSLFIFAFTMMPVTAAITAMRAPSAHLMLAQQNKDTGSASSFINFFGMLMGSFDMLTVSGGTRNLVLIIGVMQTAVGLPGYFSRYLLKNNRRIIQRQ